MTETTDKQTRRGERRVAAVMISLVVLVAFWEIMSNRSKRPFQPFQLTAEDFADFTPVSEHWNIQQIPVHPDPIEPNILAFVMVPRDAGPMASSLKIFARLVHGYNLVDCMREKGYQVELLADTRAGADNPRAIEVNVETGKQIQIWRLSSQTQDSWTYVSSMLRDGDFGESSEDTRSMAFPRIGIPDHPGWFPRGLSKDSLKRPIHNFRLFMRAKWNSSRMDVMTFLGLKQPAWASDDLLTLVAQGAPGAEPGVSEVELVLAAHTLLYEQLATWRQQYLLKEGTDE